MRTPDVIGGRWTISVLVGAVLACWIFFAARWYQTGWDFPVFYIAASLPLGALYSHSAFATYWQHHLAPLGVPHWAHFLRLPFFAILLRPLSMLSYRNALLLWTMAGLSAYFASVTILIRRFHLPGILVVAFEELRSTTDSRPAPKSAEVPLSSGSAGSRPVLAFEELAQNGHGVKRATKAIASSFLDWWRAAAPFALLSFFPALAGLISGQDNCFLLLAVTGGWVLLENRRDWLAGFAFAVCLYKFNLVVLIPPLLLLHKRFRALTSFLIAATFIAGISFAITPLKTYATVLAEAPNETVGFFPFGLRGLSIALGQEWLYPVLAAAVVLVCSWAMWRSTLTQAFCIAVTGGLLIVPYVCWYDSTLLAIPIAVLLASGSARVRMACVAVLMMGPAWRYLFVHVGVETFVLVYFLHRVTRSLRVSESSPGHGGVAATNIGGACR